MPRWRATLLILALAARTAAHADDDAAIRARLDRLEALARQLHRLEAQRTAPLEAERAEAIRRLAVDILDDADARRTALGNGASAGWDHGFFLASADGALRLEVSGYLQVRFVANHRRRSGGDDDRQGFENRRTKIHFHGHVGDPTWRYRLTLDISRSSGGGRLSDGYIAKDLGDAWTVQVGQFKPPFLEEELVAATRQLAADRSLVNRAFRQGRSQGIAVAWEGERLRARAMYHDGFESPNVPALVEDVELSVTGRAEWLAAGESWSRFGDFSSWGNEPFAAKLGAAAHYERAEYGSPSGPEEKTLAWTVDGAVQAGPASAFAAIVGRHLDVADADQLGVVVQTGVFILPDTWEVFARYEYGDLDTPGVADLQVITIGTSRFWAKQTLRWTTDVGYGLSEVDAMFARGSLGWRPDAPGEDGQIVARSQVQLKF